MLGFVLGAVAGALAATYWHTDLKSLRADRVPEWRQRAADKVEDLERAVVGSIGTLSSRASSTLRSGRPARGRVGDAAPGEGTHPG